MQKDNKNFPILLFFSLRLEYDEKKNQRWAFSKVRNHVKGVKSLNT